MKYDPEMLDPMITPYTKCPYCKNLLRLKIEKDELVFEERKCPCCGILIGEEEVINGFVRDFTLTQACSSANKISSLDIVIFPFLGVNLLLLWMSFPLWFKIPTLLPYLSPIVICLIWFRKHYWYDHLSNSEYDVAVKEMKKTLLLWVVANILGWLLLFF